MSDKQFRCTLPAGARKKECGSSCEHCGWEAKEAARRRDYIKQHGLTLCADGLRRLIIRKENAEMKYKVCDYCGAHLDNGETCDCRNENNGETPDNGGNEEGAGENDRN